LDFQVDSIMGKIDNLLGKDEDWWILSLF
jgi:hypothetical protein